MFLMVVMMVMNGGMMATVMVGMMFVRSNSCLRRRTDALPVQK